jgi:hypothetical protein
MTDRQQLRQVCQWNRELSGENSELRAEVQHRDLEIRELEAGHADVSAELEAVTTLFNAAFDELSKARTEGQP